MLSQCLSLKYYAMRMRYENWAIFELVMSRFIEYQINAELSIPQVIRRQKQPQLRSVSHSFLFSLYLLHRYNWWTVSVNLCYRDKSDKTTKKIEDQLEFSPNNSLFTGLVDDVSKRLILKPAIGVSDASQLQDILVKNKLIVGIEFHHSNVSRISIYFYSISVIIWL